ncbi:cytochrome P450 [Mycolicibacterium madagascariense]|uniref:Cytochrome P450 n=1 Tax=Mycolicibacterium madagascariense TaxID=212765 RepID=A0A7I7XHY2_9MYCO|nr:cytochrome P450 [Mycolicibacterium madagascariense]MCV7015783.1 cytochrome P450 [Mycolicibacterium madagascariense]BBZ28852.1 cytochrome P450 [Mycolicibacterium madagascariense]
MAEATTDPVRFPPGPRLPKALQGLGFVTARQQSMALAGKRFGPAVTLNLPIFGKAVVISDPALIKDVFTTNPELLGLESNLGAVLGPGSSFSLNGEEHRQRRKLLVPPFHGKRMKTYEQLIEEETLREIATWPEGVEFATLESMMRITLSAILRAVFGAQGQALDDLRELLPPAVLLGSRLAVLPPLARRDFGPGTPGRRLRDFRRRYDVIVQKLVDDARADPQLDERSDVLSMMLRACYDDGSPITFEHLADELLTLLVAGHETTATTLAWTVERLRRHPRLLERLTAEVDAGGSDLLQATIWEVQRTRPVIDATIRCTRTRLRLGEWVIPEGRTLIVSFTQVHDSETNFPAADAFDPDRFTDAKPDTYTWIPYGGGVRRCIGAAFANMEMMVTLRTLLQTFELVPTQAPAEKRQSRGIANAPKHGGLAVVHRRAPRAEPAASRADAVPATP